MDTNHIDVGTLFEHARLNTQLNVSSQAHVTGCALCRDRLNWMKTVANMGPQEQAFEPPQEILESVLSLGRRESRMDRFRKVIAAILTSDSFSDLAPVGIRQ